MEAMVRQKKPADPEMEELTLEPLPSASLFGEIQETIPPIKSNSYKDSGLEGPVEDFDLEGE